MGMILFFAAVSSSYDKVFCPFAPSPVHSHDDIALSVRKGESFDARSVARLVDTAQSGNNTIGWVYSDATGRTYVVLKPYVKRDIYNWFGMDHFNHYKPEFATEVMIRDPLRLPPKIEIQSCNESE